MEKEKRSYPCGGKGPWIAGRIARGIVIGLVFALVFGLFVQVALELADARSFRPERNTYIQAIGMIVLAHILFGARGMHGMRPGFAGGRHGHGHWAWGGPCSTGDVANGHIKDWRRYDEWWEAEGREAFRKYIDSHTK